MAINVLVLGHNGMLGNTVAKYLSASNGFSVRVLDSRLRYNPFVRTTEPDAFMDAVRECHADVIVNCIGAIPQKTTKFHVNWALPYWLDSLGVKIVHPGTDCEKDDTEYGKSKKAVTELVLGTYPWYVAKNIKIIKTSIIGPEVQTTSSLLGWFLSQPDGETINGFTNHFWNGNTSLTWAAMCTSLIWEWDMFPKETVLHSDCVSKYELLCLMRDTFNKDIRIVPTGGDVVNKCLDGIKMQSIGEQLIQLKRFMYENN